MKLPDKLTQAKLKELLHYDPLTGIFTWSAATARCTKVGDIAGTTTAKGYRVITIDRKRYLAHRLAWLYTNGSWPTNMIDHKNGTKDNNRIDNLREATGAQNLANQTAPRTNTSGFKGVCWFKRCKKWKAQIRHQGKPKYLGLFDTKEEAHTAYCVAAAQIHGEFANFG